MANKTNPNSVLFLVEGHTEVEFYNKIFELKLPPRKIRIATKNLEGNGGVNEKIKKIIQYILSDKKYQHQENIYVFIAIDREGTREKEPESPIDIEGLKKLFIKNKKARIKNIWFFDNFCGKCLFCCISKASAPRKAPLHRHLRSIFFKFHKNCLITKHFRRSCYSRPRKLVFL